jgi:hypothetical protein
MLLEQHVQDLPGSYDHSLEAFSDAANTLPPQLHYNNFPLPDCGPLRHQITPAALS